VRWWEPAGQIVDNKYQGGFYDALRNILLGNGEHLWFLYTILSLYLVAPIFHSYLKSASRENKTYFLMLCGFVCFVWPIISVVLRKLFDVDKVSFDFFLMNSSIGYFIVGYFLGQLTVSTRTFLVCLVSFLIIALAVTLAGFMLSFSDIFSNPQNRRLDFVYYYNLRIPLALLLFVVVKYIGETQFYRQSKLSTAISRFSMFFFGIYIVHVLVMHTIGDGVLGFSFNIRSFDPWFSVPLVSLAIFFLSALIVWLLRKIPLVRWILP
jgi:surface polysaccharide O-acyltransferase-like enzyme